MNITAIAMSWAAIATNIAVNTTTSSLAPTLVQGGGPPGSTIPPQVLRRWTVDTIVPSNAGPHVSPSFPGFAFEVASFYDYAVDSSGQPNTFSQNLINEVLSRTGGTPIIRVGGTSGDHGSFDSQQVEAVNLPATEHRPAMEEPFLKVGPKYFEAFDSFPNASFILMIPLSHRNVSNSMQWAHAALPHINHLDALEVGNEPDFYPWFSDAEYKLQYSRFAAAVQIQIAKLAKRAIFQVMDLSWRQHRRIIPVKSLWSPPGPSNPVKQFAYHYYQSGGSKSPEVLSKRIANHSWTVNSMAQFRPSIDFLREKQGSNSNESIPLIIDELGANMIGGQGHNNLATALWAVDYQLHCMAIGIRGVNFQQIVHPGFNLWQPVHSRWGPPMVRANFYALPFVADFIGKNSPRVHEVPLPGPKSDTLAAYTAWEDGRLVRIAIVNLGIWTGEEPKPLTPFEFVGLPDEVTSVEFRYLQAPEGSLANDTLEYTGLKWTYESNGKAVGKETTVTKAVVNNTFSVAIDPATAIIIILRYGSKREGQMQNSRKPPTTTKTVGVTETITKIVTRTLLS